MSDFPTDLCSTKLLSSWIPNSTSKPHWQLIDKNHWKRNNSLGKKVHCVIPVLIKIIFSSAFTRDCDVVTSPNLPEVIKKIRGDTELSICLRASLVYRGIPVMATSNSSIVPSRK